MILLNEFMLGMFLIIIFRRFLTINLMIIFILFKLFVLDCNYCNISNLFVLGIMWIMGYDIGNYL